MSDLIPLCLYQAEENYKRVDYGPLLYYSISRIGQRRKPDELQAVRKQIMETGIVLDKLQRQRERDYVQTFPRFYPYKYRGLVSECGQKDMQSKWITLRATSNKKTQSTVNIRRKA
ncbi:MAG TPA: hypothetical protein VJ863_10395 [Sphaerochaeta sp.]|nr:hypothetical protein [Sphaerochaeta sp.]